LFKKFKLKSLKNDGCSLAQVIFLPILLQKIRNAENTLQYELPAT